MYSVKLIGRHEIALATMQFHFERPQGFEYLAGQTVDLTLLNPPETDTEGNRRTFSLLSAPHEPELVIATRMRDTAFKRNLKNMPLGKEIRLEGPYGSFTLHEKASRPAVFLAGGIGISIFFSMIKDATERLRSHKLILFYANRRPEDAAFLADLQSLASKNSNFTFVPTMTNMKNSAQAWSGENGYVDTKMIARHADAASDPVYYLAGPQGMVLAMRNLLTESGVSKDDIRLEEFAGY